MTVVSIPFRERVLAELRDQGFSVVEGVLSPEECQQYSDEFKEWVEQYRSQGATFRSFQSLVQSYRIGHFNAAWATRLKVKRVFAEIWGTEKLLTSVDGIAVSPPLESMPGICIAFATVMYYNCCYQGNLISPKSNIVNKWLLF